MKRNLLHLLVPVTALALSACGTLGPNTQNQPFDYPQSDGFAGNFLAGKVAQSDNADDAAAQYLFRAQKLEPGNDDLRRRTFLALISDGRIADSATIAKQLLVEHPQQDLFAVLAVTDADIRAQNYQAALDTINTLPNRGLNSIIRPIAQAWLYTALERRSDALAALDSLQINKGLAPLSEYHRGLILDYFGDLNGAERALANAYGDPADAPLRAAEALGAIYERKGQNQKAELLYQSYMDRHPQSLVMPYHLERLKKGEPPLSTVLTPASGLAEGYLDIATLLSQENAVEPALIMAQFSLSLRPGDAVTKLLVGEVMEIQKRWPEAIAIYKSIPENSPHSWNARLREAASLTEIDQNDAAISLLRTMINERPDRADALIQLGDVLRATKQFSRSADAYSEAIDRLGGAQNVGWRLLYRRGISYEQAGQWDKAEQDFLLALEMEPDQPYIMNYLAYSWVDRGMNFDKAQEMLKRAVALKPDDGFIVDSLGWVYYKLGHYEKAVTQLEHAVSLIPDDPTLNDHLGDAYYQVGRYHEAEFQWRRSLSFDPSADLRKEVLAKLNGKKPATGTAATN
ncbi:tetratricopeptide repeat protein [Thalassospira sp. TSL5-1]|uniref:tetratricopeptide repeat protein n=1 Tax=Thalassospira sp. TSL5-1 TaxID=1544451 RepID=UPI000938EEB7|nr:tetratricopeptide repeat protein [Thalassospira sp. TSL5-1]